MTSSQARAPVVTIAINQAVALRVAGLPPGRKFVMQVRQGNVWMRIGTFRSRNDGSAVFPAFRVESRDTYTLRIAVGANSYRFLKVRGIP